MPGGLGRVLPPDWGHVDKYPLLAGMAEELIAPVVLGIDWYSNFDAPVKDGRFLWIGKGNLGEVRGGHAIMARPFNWRDNTEWWEFYDQGAEGACVGFAWSRAMTHLNRKKYAARALYHEAQRRDPWPGGAYPGATEFYEGTTVRAGGDVLRDKGHRTVYAGVTSDWKLSEGVERYRWATDWNDVRKLLNLPDWMDGVPLINSWGRGYPHMVRLVDEVGEKLLRDGGEAAIITDR